MNDARITTTGFMRANRALSHPALRCAYRRHEKGTATMAIEAYCMKCKEKKEMKDPVEGTTKNGKPITKGTCPVCGSTICRIGATK